MIEAIPEGKRTDEVEKLLSEEKSLGEPARYRRRSQRRDGKFVYAVLH
jgi:hypothetical protein